MPKRTVAEWITVARISRDIGHLFFEGPTDARVLAHAAGYPADVDFRSADEIEDGAEGSSPLLGGNKLRLLNLSIGSERAACNNVRCVVDADFAPLVSDLRKSKCLIQTDFANLPVSTFTFDWFRGFVIKGYGWIVDEKFWELFTGILKFAFIARFFMALREEPRRAAKLSDFISLKKGDISFDKCGYIARYFQVSDENAIEISDSIHEYIDWLNLDARRLTNSNDLFDILHHLLRANKSIAGAVPYEAIRQAYFSAIDDDILRGECFKELYLWLEAYRKKE